MNLVLVGTRTVQDEWEGWKEELCVCEGATSQRELEKQNMQ